MLNVDCVIGIDCGSQGGFAVWRQGLTPVTAKMPKEIDAIRDFLAYYSCFNTLVFLEKVQLRPDDVMLQDGKAMLGKMYRMQKLLANFEQIKAILETEKMPYCMVHPQKWISGLGLRTKGGQRADKTERKNRYKQFAKFHYPETKVTLWNADALCLMHWGRKMLSDSKGANWIEANLPKREYQKIL